MRGRLVLIDDSLTLGCPPAQVLACLDGPEAIAAWFHARRLGDRTMLRSSGGDLELRREHEEWVAGDGALTVDGSAGRVRFHGQLTIRAVMRSTASRQFRLGTEVWVHVELGPAARARRANVIICRAIESGLEHLRLEFDAEPYADSNG